MKIVVVEASALHLGFLGCYGNDWVATPNLDRLAAEGIVFDQHIANRPDANGTPARDAASHVHRADAIADLGRWHAQPAASISWFAGPSLAPPWDLPGDLLTVYAEDESDEPPLAGPPIGFGHLDLADLDRLQRAYAAVVTYFDAQAGRFLDALRKRNLLDELLLCVTSRSGFPLGEHGMVGTARAWLHDELVHVPLILRLPGAEHGGLRIAALTQSVDLMPTLRAVRAEHTGLEGPGESLWPLIYEQAEQVRPYAVSALRIGDSEEWLLRTPERALLLPIQVPDGDPPRRPQLYVKPDDRWEVNDLGVSYEDEALHLEETLRALMAAP